MEKQKSEYGEALENCENFNIHKIKSDEFLVGLYKSIKEAMQLLEQRDVSAEEVLSSKIARTDGIIVLEDKKLYLQVELVFNRGLKHLPTMYRLILSPFTAQLSPMGPCGQKFKNNKKANIILTKALKDLLTKYFGEEYLTKFEEYHKLIKDNKIQRINAKRDEEVSEVEDSYSELL